MTTERTIAVVGAGVTGLAIAEGVRRRAEAAGAPVRAVVLEAEPETGGKVRSVREAGFVVETGPHGFLDKEPKVFELIERLGLSGELIRANTASDARYVVRGGALRRLPSKPPELLSTDALPLGAKLRLLLEPLQPRGPEGIDESVYAFARRRIGRYAAENLIDAMVTGIYGGDPKQLSLVSAFPRLHELEVRYGSLIRAQLALARERRKALGSGAPTQAATGGPVGTLHSFRGGLGALTDALAERAEVRSKARVVALERSGEGFRVTTEGGERLEADAVVLAVPAYEVSSLLGPWAPEEARSVAEIPYAPAAVVVLSYRREQVAHPLAGFGFLAPHREERRVLGAIWASTVFPEHVPEGFVMLRAIVGGARRPELLDAGDEALFAMVREELEALLGIRRELEPAHARLIRWPRGIPQYSLGHAARVAAVDRLETRVPGLFVSGNAFRGVALIACIAEADRVAESVVRHVLGAPR